MDSINANQPEKNREDLRGKDAIAKIQEIAEKAQDCFFCTSAGDPGAVDARPVNVRQVDDDGNLWFLSANDSHKNLELARDPNVDLHFHGSAHSDFLHLRGRATISADKAKIDELWEPVIRTWFTGGKDDPRITVIRVEPTEGYYWDTKHGYAVAGIPTGSGGRLLISGPQLAALPTTPVSASVRSFSAPVPHSCDLIDVHFAAQATVLGGGVKVSSAIEGTIGTF